MSDSSLMFSKKSFDQNDFFIGEPKKITEKKEYLLENDKLISSPI
jgi:hypothetical protein